MSFSPIYPKFKLVTNENSKNINYLLVDDIYKQILGFGSNNYQAYLVVIDFTLSIQDNISTDFKITPNPASDFIEISGITVILSEAKNQEIGIYDVFGRMVLNEGAGSEPAPTIRIDFSKLAPGLYFIRIGDRVEKFVKI